MMRLRSLALATILGWLLVACSNESAKEAIGGESTAGTGGSMTIVSCSLGCNTFQTSQISCTVNEVFVNEELRIAFSQPVDISSLTSATFQVQETSSGLVPPGTFSADPSNPNGIIYRPLLTFNSSGSPVFGLVQGMSYEIFLPGTNLDSGPYIRSTTGRLLDTRMRCVVTAGGGVNDPVSGPPTVQIRVREILKDGGGNPVIDPITNEPFFGASVLADNATDIHRRSDIIFTFNDVMNPATLVNPVSKLSPSIRVFVDPDGDVADPTDQVELFGSYQIVIDQDELTTTVLFNPDTEFPSAGPVSQPLPRRILVTLPTTVVDLGGNSVANATDSSFVPERLLFAAVELPKTGGEDFTSNPSQLAHREDTGRSGAFWGPSVSMHTELEPGIGGGSGRLGDLILQPGELLTLYTDGMRPKVALDSTQTCVGQAVDAGDGTPLFEAQLFGPRVLVHDQTGSFTTIGPETNLPCPGDATAMPFSIPALVNDSRNITAVLIDNYDPTMTTPGTSTFQVTDGIFEFATLDISAGAVLRFVGPKAPRLFVRGDAILRGRIEVSGADADQGHDARSDMGGLGAAGGPAGGTGGNGGLRPDGSGSLAMLSPTDITNSLVMAITDLNGSSGTGYQFPSGTPGSPSTLGGGPGGTRWPNATQCDPKTPSNCDIPDGTRGIEDSGGLTFTILNDCASSSVGGPGGGGGRAQTGGTGIPKVLLPTDPAGTLPPPTPGGGALSDVAARSLAPEQGFLVGGAGGGGSGAHAHGTTRGGFLNACSGNMSIFFSNSGAGGGGAGGALQLQAGARAVLDGVIDASGGKGGRPAPIGPGTNLQEPLVSPGGGGSGGSVLIQTLNLQLPALGSRVNVTGGPLSIGLNSSESGAGSMGLVHVQAGLIGISVPALSSVAAVVSPFDPTAPSTSDAWVSVDAAGWQRLMQSDVPSVHPLTGGTQEYVPDFFSGAQSCWMRPEGNYFRLNFKADTAGDPGWTMDVRLDANETIPALTYRISTLDAAYATTTIEGVFAADVSSGGLTSKIQDSESTMSGTLGSPFIVRFQGARAVKEITDLCNVPLTGAFSPIQPDSLTPWVLHPAELNGYWDLVFPSAPGEVSKRRATMIRYQIIFNRKALNGFTFAGVDNVIIKAQPD